MLEAITRNIANKVIEENLDHLVRFAFFRMGDKPKAEDIVQEAVLRILDRPPTLFKKRSLKAYLFRTVYNLCQDAFREGHRYSEVPLDSIEEPEDAGEETLDVEESRRINDLLKDIPQKESEVIRMSVIDELSFAEISRIMQIPQSTVKYRFKCGMKRLRQLYSTLQPS